ncbi:MAG: NADPH-dependent FMN reductase [Burkholderiales bacterium]
MSIPHIAVIIGSTRDGRFGDKPANWLHGIARQRSDMAFELVDLRDHPLPFFNEAMPPVMVPAKNEAARRWAQRLAAFDGFIVVTPEYNHGPTAVLKNAFDSAYAEFNRKPLAFVGYGSVGAARSIEQLRLLATSFQMASLNSGVNIGMAEFTGIAQHGKTFDDYPYLAHSAVAMLDDLAWWTKALKPARDAT